MDECRRVWSNGSSLPMLRLLAANLSNRQHIGEPLPLMSSSRRARVYESLLGAHEIFVPSNLGGRLIVAFGAKHKDSRNSLVVFDPEGVPHTVGANERVHIDVAPGKRGDGMFHVAVLAGSGKYSIFALFQDKGGARELDGSYLIPWNFWYWPYGHGKKDETAWGSSFLDPLSHYGRAFEVGEELQAWEKAHHNDPDKTRGDWWGHCDHAALASVLFEEPPAQGIEHNGVRLTAEDLKFYATEYVAQLSARHEVWALPRKGLLGRESPYHRSLPYNRQKMFAASLVSFHQTLQYYVRGLSLPLMMDLRDENGVDHTEVWNHIVYYYETRYWQESPRDLHVVEAKMVLCANADTMTEDGASSGLPAEIKDVHGEPTVVPNGTGRVQTTTFRLRFLPDGEIDTTSQDNRWRSVSSGVTELHAPRYAFTATMFPHDPALISYGNPFIKGVNVLKLLTPRPRFLPS